MPEGSNNHWKTAAVFTRGIARIPHLEEFLSVDRVVFAPKKNDASQIDVVVGWGKKRNTKRAAAYARRHSLPCVRLEDGFLRSVGLGVKGDRPLSLVLDELGIYYDATQPSNVEQILNGLSEESSRLEDTELLARARRCIDMVTGARLSKYNDSPSCPSTPPDRSSKQVLIIDQTRNDQSIKKGLVPENGFHQMLEAALDENPDAEIIIKTHPDVIAGKRKGNFPSRPTSSRVRMLGDPVNPLYLLEQMDRVYTATSQMGFEALMLGKPVICFGAPFYAGWGLTDDRVEIPRRTKKRTVEQVFMAAYILSSRYISPETGKLARIEDVVDYLIRQRHFFDLNEGVLFCVGFSLWKRNYASSYLKSPGNRIVFVRTAEEALRKGFDKNSRLVVWGVRDNADIKEMCENTGVPIWRMEDGFLRSIGLGSDLTAPASLVIDRSGIYYDPSGPSDLETLLEQSKFSDDDLKRAARLRKSIISLNISKYNVDSTKKVTLPSHDGRKVILVPGQVEDDASIQLGCSDIDTNLALLESIRKSNPDAFVVFKPHPDVVSGNRKGRVPPEHAASNCDLLLEEASISSCLDVADEVHTMTSLVGFEALLRQIDVTTYGQPFYSGFGLTRDRHSTSRRTRKLTLDELVAAVLIRYPRYINTGTTHFTTPEHVVRRLSDDLANDAGKTTTKTAWHARQLRKLIHVCKGILNAE